MSTPSEPRPPHDGPALEPIRVLRPRRTDALAELMREFRQDTGQEDSGYESAALPGRQPAASEALTQELPPVARATRPRADAVPPGAGLRRAAVAVAVLAAAVIGFGGALLLRGEPGDAGAAPAPHPPRSAAPTPDPTPTPTPTPPATAAVDPDGTGTLREGASGPEVTELQQRLLRIPDVYRDGSTSGSYDPTLTAAVARFQLWYGIRGDETGVYGDDTRAALESRTDV
ncbi:peptidoglycan-binding protein [Streptomyces sp. NPDC012466]|uniref:peptidoglycan-binding domain-containing protein n=1 Tax=Streptomyces sp. NPDC012466 TaxID=3364835 RepID=UPI0036E15966